MCRPSGRGARSHSRPLAQPISAAPISTSPIASPCQALRGPWLQGPPSGPFSEPPLPAPGCPVLPRGAGGSPVGQDRAGPHPSALALLLRFRSSTSNTVSNPQASEAWLTEEEAEVPGASLPKPGVCAHLRSQDVPQPGLTSSHVARVPGRGRGTPGVGGSSQGAGLPGGLWRCWRSWPGGSWRGRGSGLPKALWGGRTWGWQTGLAPGFPCGWAGDEEAGRGLTAVRLSQTASVRRIHFVSDKASALRDGQEQQGVGVPPRGHPSVLRRGAPPAWGGGRG